MHSFLVVGGSAEKRQAHINRELKNWGVSDFDQIVLRPTGESIGIAEVREFQRQLILAPVASSQIAGLISQADLLTLEAQQALLKTLEEPPAHAKIILETHSEAVLLPTLVSRCQVISLELVSAFNQTELSASRLLLQQLIASSRGKRLKILEEIAKTRQEATAWVDLAIAGTRELLLANQKDPAPGQLLRRLIRARGQLLANVNPKIVLDNIFIE